MQRSDDVAPQDRLEARLEAVVVGPAGNQLVRPGGSRRRRCRSRAGCRAGAPVHDRRPAGDGRDAGARRTAHRSGSGARPAETCLSRRRDRRRSGRGSARVAWVSSAPAVRPRWACRSRRRAGRRRAGATCAARSAPRGRDECRSCRSPCACRPIGRGTTRRGGRTRSTTLSRLGGEAAVEREPALGRLSAAGLLEQTGLLHRAAGPLLGAGSAPLALVGRNRDVVPTERPRTAKRPRSRRAATLPRTPQRPGCPSSMSEASASTACSCGRSSVPSDFSLSLSNRVVSARSSIASRRERDNAGWSPTEIKITGWPEGAVFSS